MPFTNPPSPPPEAPAAPVRGTAPFAARVDAFLGFITQLRAWLAGFVTWANTNLTELWAVYQDVTNKAGQVNSDAQAAAASALAATNTVGDFPKRYLGPKAADPTTDNAGQPLAVGALYWNTPTGQLRAWSGAAWAVSYLPVGDYLTKAGGTLTGALNEARGASIPSAATLDLNAATGNFLHITGTNAVTAVTLAPGAARTVIFDAALPLTHSATLQLPGLANIVTAPGDRATFRGDSGGVVHCIYDRLDGKPIVGSSAGYMRAAHQLPTGSYGGTGVNGGIRTINTVLENSIAGASLSSNQIFLPAGAYRVSVNVCASATAARIMSVLFNESDNVKLLDGTSVVSVQNAEVNAWGQIVGRFTLNAGKYVSVRTYAQYPQQSTGENGWASNRGSLPETYLTIEIEKAA
ncbi:hypothetical protein [uncultured Xylophilus sp.]|uniref:hypothetical protein n=1 Tax=uncultured Xylophilus sp. TaxID=296832 RepID=UPI0025FC5D4B|nr:hypothetical protein [uncultured Xylophilus sp.]